MLSLGKLEDDSEAAPAAREAYSTTLAKHHSWGIRTIASLAMRTLPKKKALMESSLGKTLDTNETITMNERVLRLAKVSDTLFNLVDKYYEENQLQDLP